MKPPALARRLSVIDAAFLYLERKEIPLNIAGVCIFDGPIPFREFLASMESRLHLLPRYQQVAVAPPFNVGYPVWQDYPEFEIREHIIPVTLEDGDEAELEALSSRLVAEVMDRRKPLWQIHVVDGLKDGRGALIARIHHALADGVSGASLMRVMLDSTPAGSPRPPKPRVRARRPVPAECSLADALTSALHTSLENMITAEEVLLDFARSLTTERTQAAFQGLLGLLPELTASSERLPFNQPCGAERKFCWTELDFAEAEAVRTALGGKLNDVVLTVVTRAISRYMELHGHPVAKRFARIVCPVSVRRDDQGESLGNQISYMPVALPLDIRDPAKLLSAVATRTEIMKSVRASHFVALLTSWIGAAPPPLQAAFWWGLPMLPLPAAVLNMICTNVPGSPVPLYALGRRMLACYPHVPTGHELGVNCAVTSYAGKLQFGFTADAQVVPDVGRMRDFLKLSFEDLCKAAGLRKKARRRPARKAPAPAKTAVAEEALAMAGD
jgi:diacylglycerol O-acyltransferase